jgi:hypothetical protein
MFDAIRYRLIYLRHHKEFAGVGQFCLFTGYPRSGHSLVGALMDAHPEMIISHELDVIEQIIRHRSWKIIYAMILENSKVFAKRGRAWSGYNYAVKGAWQGRFTKLKVIGDKRGGRTSLLLTENFSMIEKIRNEIPVPVRFIHVVRNPFDNIVTRVQQGNDVRKEITPEGVREHIRRHFEQAATNQRIITESGCHVLTIRHEELIHNPEKTLIGICNFLELEAPVHWLKACASIVFSKPKKTRHQFDYPQDMIDEIMQRMKAFPFFEGYSLLD